MIKEILKVYYNTTNDTTTIIYIESNRWGKSEEKILTFKGKMEKKKENPTEWECLESIKLKGGNE